MIKTITTEPSSEADAAKDLESLILKENEYFKHADDVDISIIPSVQCFGQETRDVDLVFLMYDKRQKERLLQSTKDNRIIRSLCVTIEVKSHSGDAQFQVARARRDPPLGDRRAQRGGATGPTQNFRVFLESG